MPYPSTPADQRRRGLILAGITVTLLLSAALAYTVLVHRSSSNTAPPGPGSQPLTPPAIETKPVVADLPALDSTSDPDAFARRVAEAIFVWDTTTLVTRTDHLERLIEVADPTGESTPGLVFDLSGYLPTQPAWADLAQHRTRQWLTTRSVTTPTTWAEAQAQAGDQLLPGSTARTIHATRHRAGTWNGEPVASEHNVAFTVFIVCGPSYPRCHLLRLSMLDTPLD